MKQNIYITILVFLAISLSANAVDFDQLKDGNFQHKIVAGFNVGASAPVSIPREVRSIDGFWVQANFKLGYDIDYMFKNSKWGIGSGISLNHKGMGVRDKVKYMYTEVQLTEESNDILKGYFVGKNETRVRLSYITVPLHLLYKPNSKWSFRTGMYVSYLSSGDFEGEVWDGYLREGSVLGEKIIIDKDKATFEFGNKLRRYDWGISVGAEKNIHKKFAIFGNLDWGLSTIFPSSFKGVDMKMYNIYFTVGMTYIL